MCPVLGCSANELLPNAGRLAHHHFRRSPPPRRRRHRRERCQSYLNPGVGLFVVVRVLVVTS